MKVNVMRREEYKKSIPALVYQSIFGGIRFIWPFFRFFVVALAWGAPFILLLDANSGAAPDPMLARILESITWPFLFLIPPFFAIVGVLLVAWLSKKESSLSVPSALGLLALGLLAVGTYFGFYASWYSYPHESLNLWIFELASLAASLVILVMPILGVMVTANAIWHRSRWLAIVWVFGFILTVFGLYWLAGKTQSADEGPGSGLLMVLGAGILLTVSFFASLIAFIRELLTKQKLGRQANSSLLKKTTKQYNPADI